MGLPSGHNTKHVIWPEVHVIWTFELQSSPFLGRRSILDGVPDLVITPYSKVLQITPISLEMSTQPRLPPYPPHRNEQYDAEWLFPDFFAESPMGPLAVVTLDCIRGPGPTRPLSREQPAELPGSQPREKINGIRDRHARLDLTFPFPSLPTPVLQSATAHYEALAPKRDDGMPSDS
ncbi:uncharacterized protein CLUP02_18147 [Colletotrichum lupini]|uniref:Uncharacterized protein n=1 Tax=Colletotrichum lupini TaxID=145971 RepID=A0A9Q8SGG1_9PEZI|nr:uncharacterized protein CLUP02_18147 [Colletotrichum lupini]UQC76633.1 hypothetical protein CLUP02_18147 [Colletotrichum lupini]